jgi:FkbM family methyltransferase
VLVEPTDYLCNQLRKERPGDTVLSVGLGAKKGAACLFQFTEHPANTFDRGEAGKNKKVYTYLGEKEIDIVPLSDVMEKYGVPDVLSIDVEGMSIDVLEGNSWDRYRPGLVVIEGLYHSYMREKGYKKVLFNGLNSFYLDARRRS